jgi:hypothetical protein
LFCCRQLLQRVAGFIFAAGNFYSVLLASSLLLVAFCLLAADCWPFACSGFEPLCAHCTSCIIAADAMWLLLDTEACADDAGNLACFFEVFGCLQWLLSLFVLIAQADVAVLQTRCG